MSAKRQEWTKETQKVVEGTCPNLLWEAGLYRYSDDPRDRDAETPVDEHNHALAALRYLVSMIDLHKMALLRKGELAGDRPLDAAVQAMESLQPTRPKSIYDPRIWNNPDFWTPIATLSRSDLGLDDHIGWPAKEP